ncbi:PQQ-binding-like beta-propeller repeat protein [Natronolimnohabitans sp. A-GB9]|uniref:outer membrane protein assembly factor BamB family protein n=1 Tax=Natronolimnohabitans sp. A-GB9 TaxID=3069757 RepID=UPI0027B44C28|nr:PQQ-binding-like beta-propeller repeat protein [Natronolimnohabitans sp. A-GB9]MDQ2049214.1 PQQ-binding-like beta-propeller repeat protein [Natronolimnohabitans sp. A-GB9]
MFECERRDVLKYTGLAVTAGTVTTGSVAAESTATAETDDWSSVRGDAGNSGSVQGTHGPEAPVAVDWAVDHGGQFAAVDGTIFLVADDGRVYAFDAADGALEWDTAITLADGTEPVDAVGSPMVADDTVYVTSTGERAAVTALDAASGERRWQNPDLGQATNRTPIVANGLVFVVADQKLYALDADTGEQRWQFDPEPMTLNDERERGDPLTRNAVAVANGTVYATSNNRLFARDAETGAKQWTDSVDDRTASTFSGRPIAVEEGVAIVKAGTVTVLDAETGDERATVATDSVDVLADDRLYAMTEDERTEDERIDGDDDERAIVAGYDWQTGNGTWQLFEHAVSFDALAVDAETVYAGFDARDETGVAAFDRDDGSRTWRLETDTAIRQVAVVDGTVYASGDGLFAIRGENTDESESTAESTDEVENTDESPNEDAESAVEEASDARTETDADDADETADGAPGLTVGTGLVGGVLSLAVLRRIADRSE